MFSTTYLVRGVPIEAEFPTRQDKTRQWRANPNPDLDLNPELPTFAKSGGLDLKTGLDLDLILNIAGFAHIAGKAWQLHKKSSLFRLVSKSFTVE